MTPRILLVDDSQDFRENFGFLLEDQGYAVTLAATGRAALAAFSTSGFDLVITDIIMPDMEGLETIRELRKLKSDIAIIAISGGGRISPEQYLITARLMGVQKTLPKPFSFTTLNQAVRELLGLDKQ